MRATLDTKMALTLSLKCLPNRNIDWSSKWVFLTRPKLQQPKYTTKKLMCSCLQLRSLSASGQFWVYVRSSEASMSLILRGILAILSESALILTSTSRSSLVAQVGYVSGELEYFISRSWLSSPSAKDGLFFRKWPLRLPMTCQREVGWFTQKRLSARDWADGWSSPKWCSFYRKFKIFAQLRSARMCLKKPSRKEFSMAVLGLTSLQRVVHDFCSPFRKFMININKIQSYIHLIIRKLRSMLAYSIYRIIQDYLIWIADQFALRNKRYGMFQDTVRPIIIVRQIRQLLSAYG